LAEIKHRVRERAPEEAEKIERKQLRELRLEGEKSRV